VDDVSEERERREELARRAAGGDRRALDDLLAAVRPDVLRQCARVLPHPMDAEEACQDTLLAVSRRIGTFEGRSRFSTWLYQVAANASLDTYRRLKRRAAGMTGEELPEITTDLRTSVIAGTRLDLLDALEQVDGRVGEPVVLRDLLGLDYAEIAEVLGIPTGTVKSRIHEGRQSLQRILNR
jgi:RNA polymerase sigma-70 factor (ECF subfamily)